MEKSVRALPMRQYRETFSKIAAKFPIPGHKADTLCGDATYIAR